MGPWHRVVASVLVVAASTIAAPAASAQTGGQITGVVTDIATSTAIGRFQVQLFAADGTFLTSNEPFGGAYSFSQLPTGRYLVKVVTNWDPINNQDVGARDYVDQVYPGVVCMGCDVTIGTPIQVIAGQTTGNINFALSKGGSISGTVRDEIYLGLASSSVYVYVPGRPIPARQTYVDWPGSSGTYTFSGLAPGSYVVRTQASEGWVYSFYYDVDEIFPDVQCAPVEKLTSPTDGCVSSGTLVTVTAGTIRSGVDFSLATGSTIDANVTDLPGHGLAGSSGYEVYSAAGVKLTMGLGFLPAGTFFIRSFNDQGYIDERYDNQPCAPASLCVAGIAGGTPIVVGVAEQVGPFNLALAQGGRIAGVIKNAATNSPAAGVPVRIFDTAGQFISDAVSDSVGAYVSRAGLPSGTYYLRTANAPGFQDALYNGFACAPSCAVTSGTAVSVAFAQTTTGIDFALQPKPGAFTKTSPLDGTTGLLGSVTLTWTASASVASYEYCIDTTNDDACSSWISAGTNTSVVLSGLTIGTTYFWQVRATNSYGTTYAGGSSTRGYGAFTMLGFPAAFSKASPANGSAQPSTVTLTWGASAGAASYEYCIDTTNDNACSNWTSAGSATTAVVSDPSPYFSKYYWHVRANNAIGATYANGSATAFWAFDHSGYPNPFDRISPANGSSVSSGSAVTLTWAASFGATSYAYCLETFNNPACNSGWISTGSNTSVVLNGLQTDVTYYWHVRAVNAVGVLVAGGDPAVFWTFTPRNTQGAFGKTSPLNGAIGVSKNATLSWQASAGATRYEYCLGLTTSCIWTNIGLTTSAGPFFLSAGTTYYWQIRAMNSSGYTYANGSANAFWSFTTARGPITAPSDFDGDSSADLAVYRPSEGRWYVKTSGSGFASSVVYGWGTSTDLPAPGDYDGDGKADLAVFRPSTGYWYILKSSTNFTGWQAVQWGLSGDILVQGDYDGDGKTDIAVYRPSSGTWYVLKSSSGFTAYSTYSWGIAGDVPLAGDFDGDGRSDLAIFRPSSGQWFILKSNANFTTWNVYQWGVPGDITVPGDYDGDGKTDIALYRPSQGQWYVLKSSTGFSGYSTSSWGVAGDVPVPSDYDGDGETDIAIYRPSTGYWFVLKSSSNFASYAAYEWGAGADVPVLGRR